METRAQVRVLPVALVLFVFAAFWIHTKAEIKKENFKTVSLQNQELKTDYRFNKLLNTLHKPVQG